MQIVIEIPDGYVKVVMENQRTEGTAMDKLLRQAVIDGEPLPKGHGDLIDINEITAFKELECNGHNVEILDEFTVIIESDKED